MKAFGDGVVHSVLVWEQRERSMDHASDWLHDASWPLASCPLPVPHCTFPTSFSLMTLTQRKKARQTPPSDNDSGDTGSDAVKEKEVLKEEVQRLKRKAEGRVCRRSFRE